MKKTIKAVAWSAIGIIFLTMIVSSNVNSEYEINWYTIDGGGGRSIGGPYTLIGTIGKRITLDAYGRIIRIGG